MKLKTIAISLLLTSAVEGNAQNPYLPLWEYTPDGEPYVFDDPDLPGKKRVYVYGSHDSMVTGYCGREPWPLLSRRLDTNGENEQGNNSISKCYKGSQIMPAYWGPT